MLILFLFMSLSGTIYFLFYLLLELFTKNKTFSYGIKYTLLRMNLLLFLIPFPLLAGDYRGLLDRAFNIYFPYPFIYNRLDTIHVFTEPEYKVIKPSPSITLIVLLIIWGIGISISLFKKHKTYRKFNAMFPQNRSFDFKDENTTHTGMEIFHDVYAKLHMHRRIYVRYTEENIPPFVTGLWRTYLYLPTVFTGDESAYRMILTHELTHIKRNDYVIRILTMLVVILNWYNPFAYYLFAKMIDICELSCDEKVLTPASPKERSIYGNALLDFAEKSSRLVPAECAAGFSNKRNLLVERIKLAKNIRITRKAVPLIPFIVLILFFVSTLPVLAYYPTITEKELGSYEDYEKNMENVIETDTSFTYGSVDIEELAADDFFTDEDGNIYIIDSSSSMRASCKHTYVSGVRTKHTKKTDGSCTVTDYNSKRCTKCGNIIQGSIISTLNYTICPH